MKRSASHFNIGKKLQISDRISLSLGFNIGRKLQASISSLIMIPLRYQIVFVHVAGTSIPFIYTTYASYLKVPADTVNFIFT